MLGTWRWFLALLVVVGHLSSPWWPASFGVFSFYIISGFLMALITNERYGFGRRGLQLFWKNRFLRIFPPYYLACLISVLVILVVPSEEVHVLNNKMLLPHTWFEDLTNLFIVGLQEVPDRSSLVPPAWSLSIELIYYAIISFWAARSIRWARLFLALSVAYLAYVYIANGGEWWDRYFHVGAGALPFAVGVNLYFDRDRIWSWLNRVSFQRPLLFAAASYVGVFVAAYKFGHVRSAFFYLNIVTSALLLLALCNARMPRVRRVDKFLGGLSFPTYLFHWQAGIFVTHFFHLRFKSSGNFWVSLTIVTVLSVLESRWLSGRLDAMRERNKKRLEGAEAAATQPAWRAA